MLLSCDLELFVVTQTYYYLNRIIFHTLSNYYPYISPYLFFLRMSVFVVQLAFTTCRTTCRDLVHREEEVVVKVSHKDPEKEDVRFPIKCMKP